MPIKFRVEGNLGYIIAIEKACVSLRPLSHLFPTQIKSGQIQVINKEMPNPFPLEHSCLQTGISSEIFEKILLIL